MSAGSVCAGTGTEDSEKEKLGSVHLIKEKVSEDAETPEKEQKTDYLRREEQEESAMPGVLSQSMGAETGMAAAPRQSMEEKTITLEATILKSRQATSREERGLASYAIDFSEGTGRGEGVCSQERVTSLKWKS
ncbi:hypothetical protein NDU88_007656 [Pleurodeles waltl]|uniref:Uncharacterized protein n=1 Tax=Pleurodeles waltl TaxID=8319 RepID=A0AAV7PMI8_PLEWA|nr:hypothetical protein NDU88_007656 [Pleurodeles waltl]